jgi:hypothetical protein
LVFVVQTSLMMRSRCLFTVVIALLGAGCAGMDKPAAMGPAPETFAAQPACEVTIFPELPPYPVDDLGPIQAPCYGAYRSPSAACGIYQPNLRQVACSSGADTVFGVYETVGPESGWPGSDRRVIHARLGRRRASAAAVPSPGSS